MSGVEGPDRRHVDSLLGRGVYTVPEAAHVTGVSAGRIRRWLRGYTFVTPKGERRHSPPVWKADLDGVSGPVLTFQDLLEVRFVSAFVDRGVRWSELRGAATAGVELLKTTHPFSSRRFQTDGRRMLVHLAHGRKGSLLEIASNNFAIEEILAPLLEGVEFAGEDPVRWWPSGFRRQVVLDPRRSFGHPIAAESGISTDVLADGYHAEESYPRVARWFGIQEKEVRAAVKYEASLAA
jgi:uncharacterized protein (DUF433 family)